MEKIPRSHAPELNEDEQDFIFQITDWYIPEADRAKEYYNRKDGYPQSNEPPEEYKIYMFGVTKEGYSICVEVKNFQPYFFLKLPESWENLSKYDLGDKMEALKTRLLHEQSTKRKFNKSTQKWEEYESNIIPYKLRKHLVELKVIKRKNFWGFTNQADFRFIKITMKSLALFNIMKRFFAEESQVSQGFAMYESNIDPFLRFIHTRNIEPCGWVKIQKWSYEQMSETESGSVFSRANYNISVDYNDVYAQNINQIAPLLIASFDIECTSSHGDFPVAKKNYKKLANDLIATAQTLSKADIIEELTTSWILDAFEKETIITNEVTINQVFPKEKLKRNILEKLVIRITKQITEILKTMAGTNKTATTDGTTDFIDDDSGSDEDEKPVATKRKEDAIAEETIIKLLDKHLPELKGDPVIQIGTTVNIYGSDEIVFKHIITLNSCESLHEEHNIIVEAYDTEEEVLIAWKDLIARLDPDILTGYNIFGFDMQYVWQRAEELSIEEDFATGLGRIKERKTFLDRKELSSSALGDNIMYIFDMDGVVLIDMLKVMQRDHKLDSYKLDAVANHFLKDAKEDLKPREIFEKFLGDEKDRAVIAVYCIKDCMLCNRLMHKLKVLENNVGMGNVCSVPLSYLFMRGQGIKIFSLVAKECRAKKHLIPVLKSSSTYAYANKERLDDAPPDEDGYEGAIVLPPQEGMYLEDPITVLDYSSLYPSSMISRNLSHDSYVADMNSPYAHLESEGFTYHKITYDVYEGKGDAKHVVGKKECVFAQFPDGKKGIIPSILMKLLQQRKNTRKKIEYETVILKTMQEDTTGKQVDRYSGLVKETENTYDVLDVEKGETIKIPKENVLSKEDTFNAFEKAVLDALQLAFKVTANSLYGQIGSRMSQIYLKEIAACTTATGREMIMTAKGFVERQYNAEVIYGDSVTGDTPILIRDKQNLHIYVITMEELANITKDKQPRKWVEYQVFKKTDTEEAERKNKEQAICTTYEVWTDDGWSSIIRLIRHKCNKKIYRIINNDGIVDVTEDHSLMTINREPIKPDNITSTTKLLKSFPDELILHTQFKNSIQYVYDNIPNKVIIEENKLKAQQIYITLKSKGYDVLLAFEYGKYHIAYDDNKSIINVNYTEVIQLYDTGEYTDYVYDIETGEGVFQAGIGCLILKNTDSIFCKFPVTNDEGERLYGREALPLCIAAGQKASKEIKSILPPPQCLEYEKTMWPFILLSKKRYVGNLYEDDANKKPKQKSMGIVLKRRDNAPIVKVIYGGIIDILLNKNDFVGSVNFLKEQLQNMVDGNVDLTNLIISKTLKANYKDPTKIAHRVLASRMGERDAGNKPMINDRIPYVYIKLPKDSVSKLQGDRIEHPDYIREMNLTPDFLFYITNQLIKPISQLYALCVEKIPGYSYPPEYWIQWDTELCGKELYTNDRKRKDRITALKMKEVESLLFYPYMIQLNPDLTKKRAAAKPRNKKGTGTNNTPEVLPELELKLESKVIEITVKAKAGKKTEYNGFIKISDNSPSSTVKEVEVEVKGVKHFAYIQTCEKAFKILLKDFPELKGIPVKLRMDKSFIKTLKKAYQIADIIEEEFKKALKEQHDSKIKELQELQQTANILAYFELFPFVFDPV